MKEDSAVWKKKKKTQMHISWKSWLLLMDCLQKASECWRWEAVGFTNIRWTAQCQKRNACGAISAALHHENRGIKEGDLQQWMLWFYSFSKWLWLHTIVLNAQYHFMYWPLSSFLLPNPLLLSSLFPPSIKHACVCFSQTSIPCLCRAINLHLNTA